MPRDPEPLREALAALREAIDYARLAPRGHRRSKWEEAYAAGVAALAGSDPAGLREAAEAVLASGVGHIGQVEPFDRLRAALAGSDPAAGLLAEGIEAFRLTREYVGEDTLPAVPGWSWFDWCEKARAAALTPSDTP